MAWWLETGLGFLLILETGLGLSVGNGLGGVVVGNGLRFTDLSLGLPFAVWWSGGCCWVLVVIAGFAVCSLVEWWLLLGFGGYCWVLVVAA